MNDINYTSLFKERQIESQETSFTIFCGNNWGVNKLKNINTKIKFACSNVNHFNHDTQKYKWKT